MAPSPFFARIKQDVLAIVMSIPPGRITSFAEIGAHLDVMPRHVAYILRMLDPAEQKVVPWHRVVATDGALLTAKSPEQAHLLTSEGVAMTQSTIADIAGYGIAVLDLPHGVSAQRRPADAPKARPRKR